MSSSSPKKWLRVLGWSAVVATGWVSLATLAWSRGEPVNALWVAIAAELACWEHLLANTAVTGMFLVLVLLVVGVSVREWWRLLSGRRVSEMREDPYVTVSVAEARS